MRTFKFLQTPSYSTSFQVKINHGITKIPHFPKTCIKIVGFTKRHFDPPLFLWEYSPMI